MIKSVKDRESWLFNQSWYIRNIFSIFPIQGKKRSTSSVNELSNIKMGRGSTYDTDILAITRILQKRFFVS